VNREITEYVPVECLTTDPQVRKHFDDRSITGLAISLQQEGMQNAIRARRAGDKLIITCGERRWRAAIKAGLKEVPVIIDKGPKDDAAIICAQLVENVQRCDLLPLEMAEALGRLKSETGWTAMEIGRRLGLSNGMISKYLALLTLPERVKEDLHQGKIALSTAYELAKVSDPAKQAELADAAAQGNLKRDDVKSAARRIRIAAKPKEKRPTFRIKIAAGDKGTLSLSGPKVPLKLFISSLEELLARAREAEQQGTEFSAFAT
jgi:ParB family transcriptional regulator, chromosome partitioning protein